VTLLAAVLPGAGYAWSGRRVGYLLLAAFTTLLVVAAVQVRDLDAAMRLAFDPVRLRLVVGVAVTALLLWALTVATTYALVRPVGLARWKRLTGAAFVGVVCLSLAAPLTLTTRYASVQADVVADVFEDNVTATAPQDVTVADPWGGRDRVSVLLLGGDGSVSRVGIRTDSLLLLSLDTRTGDAVMFSLPRNMMRARFPADSPLHALYPDGFTAYGDPSAGMLNAVYGQVPLLHPGVLGASDNEGADAVKQAVAGSLGVPVDYYVLVNLDGFRQIVDAMGGVTVSVNERVAIHGDQDLGVPPVGYLEPGPDQRLDGYEALWFARGRYGSDDYARMLRQRCLVRAIIEEARPLTLLRRYEALVSAGRQVVRTDIPADLLPAFVDLALRAKEARVRSVVFVSSERFFPGNPDFEWLQASVARALEPPPPRSAAQPGSGPRPGSEAEPGGTTDPADPAAPPLARPDPGAAVDVSESCEYRPSGSP
jgi:LCP family protein required for cell wall assembly